MPGYAAGAAERIRAGEEGTAIGKGAEAANGAEGEDRLRAGVDESEFLTPVDNGNGAPASRLSVRRCREATEEGVEEELTEPLLASPGAPAWN